MNPKDDLAPLKDELRELSDKIKKQGRVALNEASTKSYLIVPFLRALGYYPSNPNDVIFEFTADVADKKGEKVDYAIKHSGAIEIIVECKPANADLDKKEHLDQLHRYFPYTDARFSILTNGVKYRFFSDFVAENIMDKKHFFEFNVLRFCEEDVSELKKFSKADFNKDILRAAASRSRDRRALLAQFENEYDEPSGDLAVLLGSWVRAIDKKKTRWTTAAKDNFSPLVKAAFHDFVRNKINDKLTSAMESPGKTEADSPAQDDGIVTTEEEIETYMIVRAICTRVVTPAQVTMRDQKGFCNVLFEDNRRQPILKMYYTEKRKEIGIWLEKKETRHKIKQVDDLYQHEAALLASAQQYLENN